MMEGRLVAELLENTPPRQWIVYGIMLTVMTYALLRAAGNLREINVPPAPAGDAAGRVLCRQGVGGLHQDRCRQS